MEEEMWRKRLKKIQNLKLKKANEAHEEAEQSIQKLRKIQDERAEIKKFVETNNTLSLKGKTHENIIDLIQKHKGEFIKHAEFPTDKNANKGNEISFLNSKLDKTKLQSSLDRIDRYF